MTIYFKNNLNITDNKRKEYVFDTDICLKYKGKTMNVMIIDDEKHMTEYLKHLINWNEYGFENIIIFNRGLEAEKAILKNPPNLILTDIRMPEITGLQIAKCVSDNKLDSQVIIISGYSDFEYAQKAIRYGVREFLLKPLLKKDFLGALERLSDTLELNSIKKKVDLPVSNVVVKSIVVDPIIDEVQKYIKGHYDELLTLDILSQIVHLNSSYLSAYYKKITGNNLSSFVTGVRLERAAKLLVESDLRINKIGEMVGYNKTQYFISLFKKKYGVTPQQFRREQLL